MTYCDRTDCTQVYTDRQSSAPLDINLGGLYGGEMVVKIGGVSLLSGVRKTLQARRRTFRRSLTPIIRGNEQPGKSGELRHPETDIFVGLGGRGPRP